MSQSNSEQPGLARSLSLTQATAINMIDMVGIGPFVVLSFIVSAMGGQWSIAAWLLGAVLAFVDGCVWSELGARWPEAGGSFVFLRKLFPGQGGRVMSFLFIWQTMIQAPLVVASAAIGFSLYLQYIVDLRGIGSAIFGSFDFDLGRLGHFRDADVGAKMVSGTLVLLMVWLLYRDIQRVGKISVFLWCITGGTLIWLILSGIPNFNAAQAFPDSLPANGTLAFLVSAKFGQASMKAIYSYLGYYNVCHLGAEIRNPERNIPRAIFISITGIAILYLLMQTMVLGNLDWKTVAGSDFVVSLYFEKIYGHTAAVVATALILTIALASLFSVLLGYSRIPYAAALDGLFFPAFAKVHPKHRIPHVSLLFLGTLGFLFSLLFKMAEVITSIIVMRIVVQFLAQAVGVIAWHRREKTRPWRMPLYPLPAILSLLIWVGIFFSSDRKFIELAAGIIGLGLIVFWLSPLRKSRAESAEDV